MEEEHGKQPTSKTLRVLMVTGVYPTTARPHAGTFIKTLVEALRAAGIEVEIIHPDPGPVLWRYLSAIFQVWCKTWRGKFDIVHGHYGQWCFFARLQWKVPVVAAFLGDDLLGTVTARGGYSIKGALIVRLSRWLCRHVDAALVKSKQMQAVANHPAVRVIPDGVDFNLFQPLARMQARAELGWRQHGHYVLFGNNPAIPVKNIRLARASIAYLAQQGIEAELIVANGLPQTQLVRYINACNAVILPSHAEGSPNIVKESMACNVPVIATDVGDVNDVIWSTQGCSLCPPDPAAFALGLLRAFQHHEPTTGREDIAHLESSLIAQQTLAVYQHVLARQRIPHLITSAHNSMAETLSPK
ncbi:MAG TPA: glycosyltransferase [Ktedonobacteraceae bacterium]|nr:glycosyltransferase [Ktedonobacteraceae bacterium]